MSEHSELEAGDCFRCFCNNKTGVSRARKHIKCQDHLKNWKKWLNRRDAVHKRLKQIGRGTGDMLMNLGDGLRIINEEKEILWNTNIEDNFDRYRGNPAFWKLPLSLPNKETPLYKNPVYFAIQTKADKNELPVVDYVGTPSPIVKEKHIDIGKRNLIARWQNGEYRTSVWSKKQPEIHRAQSSTPVFDNLIVRGTQMKPINVEEKEHDKAPRNYHCAQSSSSSCINDLEAIEGEILLTSESFIKTSFKINNIEIYENCDILQTGNRKISVLFEYEVNSILPEIKFVRFENTGSTTIRFYWNCYEKFKLFGDFSANAIHPFYFNKEEFLLVPGKVLEFPIWFRATKHGNYAEFWEITTRPQLWNSEFRLLISLKGFAYIKDYEQKTQAVKDTLDTNVKESVIKDIILELLDNLKYTQTKEVHFKYSDAQLFLSANQILFLANSQPKYVFNKYVVKELQKFYEKVRQEHHPLVWDMSIDNLKKVTRERDILVFCEEKIDFFLRARNRRFSFEETKFNKNINEITTISLEVETYFQRLQKLLDLLERPSIIKNDRRRKYVEIYHLYKTYFTEMSQKLFELDVKYNIKVPDATLIEKIITPEKDRFDFERFDDTWISRIKRVLPERRIECPALPKSHFLNNIPADDIRKTHKIYFNTADTEDDKKTKKKQKGEEQVGKSKPEKTDKGDKSTKTKSEATEHFSLRIKENFDPFKETYNVSKQQSLKVDRAEISKPSSLDFTANEKLYYERYISIYNILSHAVDAMVDCLESIKAENIGTNVLGNLQECNQIISSGTVNKNLENKSQYSRIPNDTMISASRSESSHDKVYFDYLIKKHWKHNKNTKKYIINGKFDILKQETPHAKERDESLMNIFSDIHGWMKSKQVEEFSTCESKGIQTSFVEEEFDISNILLKKSAELLTKDSSCTDQTVKCTDAFYFLEESLVVDEQEENETLQIL